MEGTYISWIFRTVRSRTKEVLFVCTLLFPFPTCRETPRIGTSTNTGLAEVRTEALSALQQGEAFDLLIKLALHPKVLDC